MRVQKKWFLVNLFFCLLCFLFPTLGFADDFSTQAANNVVNVSTAADLLNAINSVTPGTRIVLADGTYNGSFSITNKSGTESNPIVIAAANQGKAIISGGGGFKFTGSSYFTIQGLTFTNKGTAISLNASHHVHITRNRFALATNTKATKWIDLTGTGSDYNWIDHNEFGPRHDLGQMISIDGSGGQVAQHTLIEFNYFHDADPQTSNGGETIRVGLSGLSMSDGFTIIQNNLFVNLDSDSEVVSVKSGHNIVRYNTFTNNAAQVTARHGHFNSYYGNFFFGDGVKENVGGFRIYANDHKIYNNYFQGLTADAINVDGGDFDAGPDGSNYTSNDLVDHWRPYRVQVTNNTVIDCTRSITIGRSHQYAPVDTIVANNIVKSSFGPLYNEHMQTNTVFEGNIGFGATLDNVTRTSAEIQNVDPLITTVNGLQKLSAASPAINAAVGSFPYVIEDMEGQIRSTNDVGADEFSQAPILHQPLTPVDVGIAGPPVTTATVSPAQPEGQNGWYVSPVTVNLSAADDDPGVAAIFYSLDNGATWQNYSTPLTFTQDGRYTISYRSVDNAGNMETTKTFAFNLDRIAPVIQVTEPVAGGTYLDTVVLSPQFTVTDDLSGVDASKTTLLLDNQAIQQGTTIPLYTLPLGTHTLQITCADLAGNQQVLSVTFVATSSKDSLRTLVSSFLSNGAIDNQGIAQSLQAKLDQNDLGSFVNEVQAQRGKHITDSAANVLIRDAQAIQQE